ncbi:hypothetical protein D3C75_1080190 [compost metagenome]
MVKIEGHDIDDFISHVNRWLASDGMFSAVINSYEIGGHTMAFLKTTCCDKLMEVQYRGILGAVYKNINLLTHHKPEELNLMGKGIQ